MQSLNGLGGQKRTWMFTPTKYDNLHEQQGSLGVVLRLQWSWHSWQGSLATSQRNYNKHWPSKHWSWEICWHSQVWWQEIQPKIWSQPHSYLESRSFSSRWILVQSSPVTGAEARATWPETVQWDGPLRQVPGDRAKRYDASSAIRSATFHQNARETAWWKRYQPLVEQRKNKSWAHTAYVHCFCKSAEHSINSTYRHIVHGHSGIKCIFCQTERSDCLESQCTNSSEDIRGVLVIWSCTCTLAK